MRPSCQAIFLRGATASGGAVSVTGVSLLEPGVAPTVIAVPLPEPELLFVHESQSGYPLGGLPEVEVRDQQPGRGTMLGIQMGAVICVCDHGLPVQEILGGEVGGVGGVAVDGGVRLAGLDAGRSEELVDGHATPGSGELRPLGHAMDVDDELGLWE